MNDRWGWIAAALAFTGLGLLAGYQAGRSQTPRPASDAAADDTGSHAHAGEIEFSPQALQNLGVTTDALRLTSWTRTRRITAVVEEAPLARRPIYAPVDGRVVARHVEPLQVVGAGEPLLELLRAPIPLPRIDLTSDALHPEHEEIHRALRSLRQARTEIGILEAEASRIDSVPEEGELPLIPRQRRIEIDYDLGRARIAVELAAHELERHGFSEEQVEQLARGEHLPIYGADNVRRTLEHKGLWRSEAEALARCLPKELGALPLAIATVGELTGHGLNGPELRGWLAEDPDAARAILPIGSLLLDGHSLPDIRALHAMGALEPKVVVAAPSDAADWDVLSLQVRRGARVTAGALLAELRDGRSLRLRATPVGSEVAALLAVLQAGRTCRATPLLQGTGPELSGLSITRVTGRVDGKGEAFLDLTGEVGITTGAESGSRPQRTWTVRPGTRYELRIPVERLDNVFVLPRTALAEDGPDRVLLLPDAHGDVFTEVAVVVAAEDDEVVVLRAADQDARLQPGTAVVQTGSFELGLAIHEGDHDVGHSHGH